MSIPYLRHLRDDLDLFAAYLAEDLTAPVRHCGDWTLHDLAEHLGKGNLWAAAAVSERRGDLRPAAPPRSRDALTAWFTGTASVLLTALDVAPDTAAWTFYPPHTAGFWQRRRSLETLVHRWDAEQALGLPSAIDPVLAADGVAEVFEVFAPRQVERGRSSPPAHAVRFTTTDVPGSRTWGPGEPVATLSGPAEAVLLMLWGRIPHADPTVRWEGDREAAAAVLAGPLVP